MTNTTTKVHRPCRAHSCQYHGTGHSPCASVTRQSSGTEGKHAARDWEYHSPGKKRSKGLEYYRTGKEGAKVWDYHAMERTGSTAEPEGKGQGMRNTIAVCCVSSSYCYKYLVLQQIGSSQLQTQVYSCKRALYGDKFAFLLWDFPAIADDVVHPRARSQRPVETEEYPLSQHCTVPHGGNSLTF